MPDGTTVPIGKLIDQERKHRKKLEKEEKVHLESIKNNGLSMNVPENNNNGYIEKLYHIINLITMNTLYTIQVKLEQDI